MYFFYFTQENLLKMYKLAGQFEFPPAAACVKGLCPFETHNFFKKANPKSDYPLKTLYPRAFQTGQNHLIYYDFTTVE